MQVTGSFIAVRVVFGFWARIRVKGYFIGAGAMAVFTVVFAFIVKNYKVTQVCAGRVRACTNRLIQCCFVVLCLCSSTRSRAPLSSPAKGRVIPYCATATSWCLSCPSRRRRHCTVN